MASGIGTLFKSDWIKGLVVAVLGAALSPIANAVQGGFSWNWKTAAGYGAVAGVAYIVKNLGTDSSGKLLGIEATGPKEPAIDPPKPPESK
jgi:hypothetical protein